MRKEAGGFIRLCSLVFARGCLRSCQNSPSEEQAFWLYPVSEITPNYTVFC